MNHRLNESHQESSLIEACVGTLFNVKKTGKLLSNLVEAGIILNEKDAYQVQHTLAEKKKCHSDESHIGYKISMTSDETQKWFNSDSPVYGILTTDNLNNGKVEIDTLSEPLVEVELMFIVDEDISENPDHEEIVEKTSIAPGIEIPDSRFENWFPNLKLFELIADSAVAGKIVCGESTKSSEIDDWLNIKATLTLDDEEVGKGYSSAVLGHPTNAMIWLAEKLASHGRLLKKGMIVSSGTLVLPLKLVKGTYVATYSQLGKVELKVG